MVTSIHLADVGVTRAPGVLARRPRAQGLIWGRTVTLAPLGPGLLPTPTPGCAGLIAAWEDDAALDAFLAEDRLAHSLAGGYFARLEPTRCIGAWPEFGPLSTTDEQPEPAAVLTIGRLRPRRLVPFLKASARTEEQVLASPALTFATGMARPPRTVCTFSVWHDLEGMRASFADSHREALAQHGANPFHSQSAFIRYRIAEQRGSWDRQTAPDGAG